MSWHSLWSPLSCILADPGAYNHGASEPNDTTHGVHDSRTCEVHCPMPQTPVNTTLGQPATTPDPVSVETIRQRPPQAVEAEILPGPAFGHSTRRDRGGGVHEHHHKEKQHHHPRVPNSTVQKPALQTDQAIRERTGRLACRIDRGTKAPSV